MVTAFPVLYVPFGEPITEFKAARKHLPFERASKAALFSKLVVTPVLVVIDLYSTLYLEMDIYFHFKFGTLDYILV